MSALNIVAAGVVGLGFAAALAVHDPARTSFQGTVDRVVDGDTIIVNHERIRLWGIDAPEAAQLCHSGREAWHCGDSATRVLQVMVGVDDHVTCEFKDTDRYKRTVARCWNAGGDLGGRLVALGLAVIYEQYSGGYYKDRQTAAQLEHLGLWCQGCTFDYPWDWRRANPRH